MVEVRTAHTAELDPAALETARALLYDVFAGLTEADWEHSLGGMHALAWEDGTLVGHAALVQRRLLHDGRALRTGYVEGVGVRADRRGLGYGAALMDAPEPLARRAYDLGALAATEQAVGFYAARGRRLWQCPLFALTPKGVERTQDEDGAIFVLPGTSPLDLTGELTCDWRDGDVW